MFCIKNPDSYTVKKHKKLGFFLSLFKRRINQIPRMFSIADLGHLVCLSFSKSKSTHGSLLVNKIANFVFVESLFLRCLVFSGLILLISSIVDENEV